MPENTCALSPDFFTVDLSVVFSSIYSPRPGESRDPCRGRVTSFVYLLASKRSGTLYVGSTIDLAQRIWEHKQKAIPGFTVRYGVDQLVWFEVHESIVEARHRERQIKEWKRDWKVSLIERDNPEWRDLYETLSL
jgi:putative endonuclease